MRLCAPSLQSCALCELRRWALERAALRRARVVAGHDDCHLAPRGQERRQVHTYLLIIAAVSLEHACNATDAHLDVWHTSNTRHNTHHSCVLILFYVHPSGVFGSLAAPGLVLQRGVRRCNMSVRACCATSCSAAPTLCLVGSQPEVRCFVCSQPDACAAGGHGTFDRQTVCRPRQVTSACAAGPKPTPTSRFGLPSVHRA